MRLTAQEVRTNPNVPRYLDKILKKMARILRAEGREARSWCYLTIRRKSDGSVVQILEGGRCPVEKASKYLLLSLEKGGRLHITAQTKGHVASSQSANEKKEQYGGAIMLGDLSFSISGLPTGLADEATSLALAMSLNALSIRQCTHIVEVTSNHTARKLLVEELA